MRRREVPTRESANPFFFAYSKVWNSINARFMRHRRHAAHTKAARPAAFMCVPPRRTGFEGQAMRGLADGLRQPASTAVIRLLDHLSFVCSDASITSSSPCVSLSVIAFGCRASANGNAPIAGRLGLPSFAWSTSGRFSGATGRPNLPSSGLSEGCPTRHHRRAHARCVWRGTAAHRPAQASEPDRRPVREGPPRHPR